MNVRVFISLLLCFGLSGCINLKPKADAAKSFVLGPVAASSRAEVAAVGALYIARPERPTYLEGTHLLYLAESGEIKSLPNVRWAEPIEGGIARALSEYLQLDDATLDTHFYPWSKHSAAMPQLHLYLHQFIATEDGRILLSATWRVAAGSESTRSGAYTAPDLQWTPGDASSLVVGLNAALEGLAKEIKASL